jgi:alpha-beta hydrolase superfamily lysophospholipase
MRQDIWYDSKGAGRIHACRWTPEGKPRAVVQIIHGIAEFVERYDDFANFLTNHGILVVAEDHMGHGQSINGEGIQGYFHAGWFTAVDDTMQLLEDTQKELPEIPYILFGHSMGSFMARTILCKYPDCGLTGAVICGTGWQPAFALPALIKVVEGICKATGETKPNEMLQNMVFGGYNKKVEHPRTSFDWLSRDSKIVDEYIAHPLCGFTASAGLLREMLKGIHYIEQQVNLTHMKKSLPVFFIAGGDDPVGPYGKGVHTCAEAFRKAGMEDVSVRIYPLCRHEILNEINREQVYADVLKWVEKRL